MFNNSSNLYGSEWLALVFANRNKSYGAYELRTQSSKNLLKAFLIVVPLFVALFFGPHLISMLKGEVVIEDTDSNIPVVIGDFVHQNKIEPMPKETPKRQTEPAKSMPQVKVKTVGLTDNIKVVPDELAKVTPPTSDEVNNSIIGSISQDGIVGKGNAAIGDGKVGGAIEGGGKGAGNGDAIIDASGVDVYPEFPGGMEAWSKFIQNNLRYPSMASENGVQGRVFVSFVVEKNGTITDVKVIKGIGYGCDDEAIRVIKKSPRWKVGMQNNLPVRVRYNMPISYALGN